MIRLYAVNILPLKNVTCFEASYMRSSKERQEKADMLQMPSDKARCIAAGLLLEYVYEKFRIEKIKELANANSFGYTKNSVEFPEKMPEIVEGLRGKPEFSIPEECDRQIYFNLSHSGNYVICAMADFEVGADIQRRTRVRDSVIRKFFTKEEQMRMDACGDDEALREIIFAQIWTLKEAETKLTGRGIGQILEQKPDDEKAGLTIWQGILEEEYAWSVVSYPEPPGAETENLEPVMVDEGELFYEGKF